MMPTDAQISGYIGHYIDIAGEAGNVLVEQLREAFPEADDETMLAHVICTIGILTAGMMYFAPEGVALDGLLKDLNEVTTGFYAAHYNEDKPRVDINEFLGLHSDSADALGGLDVETEVLDPALATLGAASIALALHQLIGKISGVVTNERLAIESMLGMAVLTLAESNYAGDVDALVDNIYDKTMAYSTFNSVRAGLDYAARS